MPMQHHYPIHEDDTLSTSVDSFTYNDGTDTPTALVWFNKDTVHGKREYMGIFIDRPGLEALAEQIATALAEPIPADTKTVLVTIEVEVPGDYEHDVAADVEHLVSGSIDLEGDVTGEVGGVWESV